MKIKRKAKRNCTGERAPGGFQPWLVAGLLLLQAVAGIGGAAGQVSKLLPADEAARDPSLFSFRAQLQAAVARRDSEALLSMVDPRIRTSFGDSGGIEAFRSQWKLRGADSALWAELGTLLALGGTFQDADTFVAPYVFSRWPESADSFEHVAVLGSGVRVRAEPGLGGAPLTALSFDVVRLSQAGRRRLSAAQSREWTAVELRDGRTGFIASRYVRSPVGYRAFLSRRNGSWRLVTLVAGD